MKNKNSFCRKCGLETKFYYNNIKLCYNCFYAQWIKAERINQNIDYPEYVSWFDHSRNEENGYYYPEDYRNINPKHGSFYMQARREKSWDKKNHAFYAKTNVRPL